MVKRAFTLAGCLGLAALSGCSAPDGTIRVAISTDAPTPVTFEDLEVTVRRGNAQVFKKQYGFDTVEDLPDSLLLYEKELLTGESSDDVITIAVSARKAGDAVIERSASLRFSPRTVLLAIPLCKSCKSKACPSGQTCKSGKCVDQAVDEAALPLDDVNADLTSPECPEPATRCLGACETPGCGACPKADKVSVAGGKLSIDASEIDRTNYGLFLATNPHPGETSDPDCSLATAYYPDVDCLAASEVCKGDTCVSHPQVCVKWCAAQQYCTWARGRLCGGIDGKLLKGFGTDDDHEWYLACGGPNKQEYPYGDAYDASACNTEGTTTKPVGLLQTCVGGEPGLHDMSGNVSEWENACEGAQCNARGGGYGSLDFARCKGGFPFERSKGYPNVGLRCCYGP